jgi:hypothetical protein
MMGYDSHGRNCNVGGRGPLARLTMVPKNILSNVNGSEKDSRRVQRKRNQSHPRSRVSQRVVFVPHTPTRTIEPLRLIVVLLSSVAQVFLGRGVMGLDPSGRAKIHAIRAWSMTTGFDIRFGSTGGRLGDETNSKGKELS